jgi:hypothetical protein
MRGIHAFTAATKDVDGPDKPGHDETGLKTPGNQPFSQFLYFLTVNNIILHSY